MPAAQDRERHCHTNTHKEHDEEECAFKVGWAGAFAQPTLYCFAAQGVNTYNHTL